MQRQLAVPPGPILNVGLPERTAMQFGGQSKIFSAIPENGRKTPGEWLTCRNVHTDRGMHVLACLFRHPN